MEETKASLIGKGFVNDNTGMQDEDGNWTVRVLFTETFYYSDGTKEVEEIETKSISMDFQEAHETALRSALAQLQEETRDKGFVSLILARKSEAQIDSGNDNEDTPA